MRLFRKIQQRFILSVPTMCWHLGCQNKMIVILVPKEVIVYGNGKVVLSARKRNFQKFLFSEI